MNTWPHPRDVAASAPATELERKLMKPMALSCADMPMSTANHRRVSHAPFSLRQSCQVMTPDTSCSDMPSIAAVTELIPILSPKIQRITVRPIVTTTMISSCESGPSFLSFSAASFGASGVSWISGGYILNTSSGVTARPTMAGTHAALNHVSQGDAMTMPRDAASFKDSKFCAAAVMHIADECPEHWSWVWMRKPPSLPDVGPGSLPAFFASDLMMGR